MNKCKLFKMAAALSILATFIFCLHAYAEDIRSRMQERLPAIRELKAEGIVGENNKGYLEIVGSTRKGEDVVQAENSDRRAVYAAIAQQQGTTAEVVGKRRAEQIVSRAAPGEWLQDENGNWYKKK